MVFASLCATLCFLTRCSNDQDPDPVADPNLVPTDVLSSLIVDSDGGVLETEGFSLTVPAGAFNSETEIKIYTEQENHFKSQNISPIYKIEGLPGEMNDPVQFKIKPSKDPDSTTFMALGTAMDFVTKDDPEFVFLLYPSTESNGDLIADFQPDKDWRDIFNSGRLSFSSIFEINKYLWVTAKNKYGTRSKKRVATTGKFNFNYHTIIPDYWIDTAFFFLKPYEIQFKDALRDVGTSIETNENLRIHINPFGSDDIAKGEYLYAIARAKLFPQPIILINSNYSKNMQTFLSVLLHLQSQYITEKFDKEVLQPNRYWYHIAIASWIGSGMFYENNRTQPLDWEGNELLALNGCIAGSGGNLEEASKHGYGMGSLFEYFELINEKVLYRDFLVTLKSYPNIIESINQLADSNIEFWWTDYIQHLINGELFEVSPQSVLDAVTEKYAINADADTSHTFTGDDYPDLSAKLYRVDLNKSFEEQDYLSINVTGNESYVSVYKISDNNTIAFIDGGKDVAIGALPDLVANGNDLLLLVTNSKNVTPYTGTTSIDCTVEHKKSEFPYNHCKIELRAKGKWEDDLQGIIENSFYLWWEAYGDYADGLFKAIHRPHEDTVVIMEIEIDPITLNILDFTATESERFASAEYTRYNAIEGSGKPLAGYTAWTARAYEVKGEETGTYIDLITSYKGSPGKMTDLLSVSYDTNSELRILFNVKQE